MPTTHLTKSDIERRLLTGESVSWKDANRKNCLFALSDPKERRLFAFLLATKVRVPNALSQEFIDGLSSAYDGMDDPASTFTTTTTATAIAGPWRLQSIETEGFGGLNIWCGTPFHFNFDQESLLIEGPNGSGKSSLIGAILWAVSGERPRDQSDCRAHELKPVYGVDDKAAGDWPPIACYPPTVTDLKSTAHMRVQLTFQDPHAAVAKIERVLDGNNIKTSLDSGFKVPSVFIETGLLMPARLAHIRFNENGERLTDAVQKLTGLDDLVAIGVLVASLCHKSREYLSYKRKDLTTNLKDFNQAIEEARGALATVNVDVPAFTIAHTDDANSEMAIFGKMLNDRATEHTKVVSNDLASGLELAQSAVQHQVISAISAAKDDVKAGIEALSTWKTLKSIAQALDKDTATLVAEAVAKARSKAKEAVILSEVSSKDSKFQLKAVAAQWHAQYKSGVVENCPLCDHDLKDIPSLAKELEALQSAGEAASRRTDDNLNAIEAELKAALPESIKNFHLDILLIQPRTKLFDDLHATLVVKERYAKTLTKFAALVEIALSESPKSELAIAKVETSAGILKKLNETNSIIERLLDLAEWFNANSGLWSTWWQNLAASEDSKDTDIALQKDDNITTGEKPSESLSSHLLRLSDALAKAEPYRKAAKAMRKAWTSGKLAVDIEKELKRREAVADSLTPLKNLSLLAESIAREAIDRLSDKIANLLKRIHLTEQLQFHDARLQRKEGLIVRGGFVPELRIDATLVANTSWLRAVLWAFLFALREEAVEQIGSDPFPLLLFDDPQSTFDVQHRHRWAQYIAALQSGPSKAQIILTTYDERFLELIKVDRVTGRQAMMVGAGKDIGHVSIVEGAFLEREWSDTKKLNTPQAGSDYISKVREHVEALLRLMLRGEDAAVMSVVSGFVLGDCREKLRQLHTKGIAPWDRPIFEKLLDRLGKSLPQIKYMEIAHHAGKNNLGMQEAIDVEIHWRKYLQPTLYNGFQVVREHSLLHGGLKALFAIPPTITLPEGYQTSVKSIPLHVLGQAAAISDGRVADGRIDFDEFALTSNKNIVLGRHFAYRLTAPTLEPVARPGDMLIVKEPEEPPAKSLVVALSGDRILARRFEISENQSDVAVLTAQAINPSQIAPPVIGQKATFTIHKIIGVIYAEKAWGSPAQSVMEVCECAGEAIVVNLAKKALGLIKVIGQSAEPYALNGQYIVIRNELSVEEAVKTLDGKPIIAVDTNNSRYFKRLRITTGDQIVLESLDSGGDYGPIVLAMPGKGKNCLARVWPVAGVLFELPN